MDAFELWCWRRLLRVPWTARRSNQSILKEISPGCSLEGLMLKMKLQYFEAETPTLRMVTSCKELTYWKRPWCWEGLGAGREGDDRGWNGWMASPTQWTWACVNSRSWWWTGRPGVLRFMGSQRIGHDWATELNWSSFPSQFITGYWIEWPVLYSRTLLFIHTLHKSLHLLIPTSSSFPLPTHFPLATTRLLYVCFLFPFQR